MLQSMADVLATLRAVDAKAVGLEDVGPWTGYFKLKLAF
jgi:aminoglycoside phosphotransferase (APT) family kinase protein